MAHLNGTQKKEKNAFIAMLIAIVVVIAAIAYVLYGGLTAKSALLENQDFATALSQTLSKAPAFISEEDLAEVKYVSLAYNSETETAEIVTAGDEFVALFKEYNAKADAGEDVSSFDFTGLFNAASFELEAENTNLDDIKYFTGAEVVVIYGVTFTDSSVFAGMTGLTQATVSSCGLTEVAGFAGLNADAVTNINLSGNSITDWSPLDYIKDKVTVNTYYTFEPSEDGTIDFNNMTLVEQTLTEYYEEQAAAEETENEAAEDATEETVEPETAE